MDDHTVDSGRSGPQDRHQTEKRLGRGLEDISHLFLSQAVKEPAEEGESRGGPLGPIPPPQPEPALVAALRPLPGVNRDQLASLLKDNLLSLEEGLKIIDVNIPFHPCGPIDLLAVDGACRLAIIDIDTSTTDSLLLRGIFHFDWLVRNVPILRRMYRGLLIDYASNPRVFLVAPDFSTLHRSATFWISSPQIKCFKYHAVAMRNGAGILVEHA